MKIALVFSVMLFSFFLAVALAQEEPPEPTDVSMTCVVEDDFQIKWFDGDWANVTSTSWADKDGAVHPAFEFLDGTASIVHKHLAGLGSLVLEANSPDSTPSAPRFVRFGIPVAAIPEYPPGQSRWWGICRVRWRCRAQADSYMGDPCLWSQQSWWVLVIGMFTVAVPVNAFQ